MFKETIVNWSNHRCSVFGAAPAYYSIFSFGPLMVIATAIAGIAFAVQQPAYGGRFFAFANLDEVRGLALQLDVARIDDE